MKKLIMTVFGILVLSSCFSQAFFGSGISKNGISAFIGVEVNNIHAQYQGILPFSSEEKPFVHAISLGYSIKIKDIVTITPYGGLSMYTKKDFSVYNKGGRDVIENGIIVHYDDIKKISDTKPLYGIEISKTWFMGRVFIYGNNYGAGIGIKVVFVDDEEE